MHRRLIGCVAAAWLVAGGAARADSDRVQLTIEQRFEEAHVHVAVDVPVRAFLGGAGIKIVPRADTQLVIQLHGNADNKQFQEMKFGVVPGRHVDRWTSASVELTATLKRGDEQLAESKTQSKWSDDAQKLPPGKYASRSTAPYQRAFDEANFFDVLLTVLKPLLDDARTANGLVALARSKSARGTREAALFELSDMACGYGKYKGAPTADAKRLLKGVRNLLGPKLAADLCDH